MALWAAPLLVTFSACMWSDTHAHQMSFRSDANLHENSVCQWLRLELPSLGYLYSNSWFLEFLQWQKLLVISWYPTVIEYLFWNMATQIEDISNPLLQLGVAMWLSSDQENKSANATWQPLGMFLK